MFHACFSGGIWVQYGGFLPIKNACDATVPLACTVSLAGILVESMIPCKSALVEACWGNSPFPSPDGERIALSTACLLMLSSVLVILHEYPTRQLRNFLQFCQSCCIHSPRSVLLTILYFLCSLLFLHKLDYAAITRMSAAVLINFSHMAPIRRQGLHLWRYFLGSISFLMNISICKCSKTTKINKQGFQQKLK